MTDAYGRISTPTTRLSQPRHAFVTLDGVEHPALFVMWRQGKSGWEGYVVVAVGDEVRQCWVPARALRKAEVEG